MRRNAKVIVNPNLRSPRIYRLKDPGEVPAEHAADIADAKAAGTPYGNTLDDAGEPKLYSPEAWDPTVLDGRVLVVDKASGVEAHYSWCSVKPVRLIDPSTGRKYHADRKCLIEVVG